MSNVYGIDIGTSNFKMCCKEKDEWVDVDAKSLVSMNMWGFYPDFIEKIEEKFHVFLEEKVKENIYSSTLIFVS